jgi:hypothetical protein
VSIYIEVHIDGEVRYRWKLGITKLIGTWEEKAKEREQQIKVYIDQLIENVMPSIPSAQYYIIFQSKINEHKEDIPDESAEKIYG